MQRQGADSIVQLVKCPLYMRENPSSMPGTHVKMQTLGYTLVILELGSWRQEYPGAG